MWILGSILNHVTTNTCDDEDNEEYDNGCCCGCSGDDNDVCADDVDGDFGGGNIAANEIDVAADHG